MKAGSRVKHWFAGLGTVRRIRGRCVSVKWDNNGVGIAYKIDCRVI
jgi:hypothetical protein